jgi:hypothetical protein
MLGSWCGVLPTVVESVTVARSFTLCALDESDPGVSVSDSSH